MRPLSVSDHLRQGLSRALDAAFPATCPGCGREGDPICRSCLPALGVRLALPPGVPIGLPAEMPEPLVQLEWCAPFAGTARAAIHALKYGGERRLAAPLGQAIGQRWTRAGVGGELLVPVPVHTERARVRGFDQAVLLAISAGAHLRLPMFEALERARATEAQYELDRRHRAANVKDAFRLRGGPGTRRRVRARWIVLVDDVVTTGATLAACAHALLDAGAMAVSAVTVARER